MEVVEVDVEVVAAHCFVTALVSLQKASACPDEPGGSNARNSCLCASAVAGRENKRRHDLPDPRAGSTLVHANIADWLYVSSGFRMRAPTGNPLAPSSSIQYAYLRAVMWNG